MLSSTELVVGEGDVEAELASVFRFELARLELDDDVSELLDVEEEEIDVEVVAVDVPRNEGERMVLLGTF